MENYIGKIHSINPNPERGFTIVISIYNESELDLILDEERETPFVFRDYRYEVIIDKNLMSHGDCEPLNEIMDVYHRYEYSDNLNATLRRQWKTGAIIDEIVYKIISSGILEKFEYRDLED